MSRGEPLELFWILAAIPVGEATGASKWQVIRHVVIPAALPDILTGPAASGRPAPAPSVGLNPPTGGLPTARR